MDPYISFRSLRNQINKLNLYIIIQNYDEVSAMIETILPQIQPLIQDKVFLSRILVNFDFHGLFSYLLFMEQERSEIENIIYFTSIVCQAQFFEPKYLLNKQNLLLLFSLIMRYSENRQVTIILLSIICILTIPYSSSYILFINNDLIQPTIQLKNYFPISHILYHIVISSFNDRYELGKNYSIMILQSSLQTLQSQSNFYDNDEYFFEEVSYSLKIFSIFLENSTFPIDFNVDTLLSNRQQYLTGPEIIQDSFLDFLLSYDSLEIEILNELLPFLLHDNPTIELKAINLFKKSIFIEKNSIEIEEEEEEAKSSENSVTLFAFPDLVEIIPQVFEKESEIIQNEAFQFVIELCKARMINSNLFHILMSRILTDHFILVDIIGGLIDEFHSSSDDKVGDLTVGEFFGIIGSHYDDLKSLLELKPRKKNLINKKLIARICETIEAYNQQQESG